MSSHIVQSSAKTGAEIRQGILESVEKTLLLNLSLEPHVCYTEVSWEVEVRVNSVPEVSPLKITGKVARQIEQVTGARCQVSDLTPVEDPERSRRDTRHPKPASPAENYHEATKGLVGKDTL